MKFLSGFKICSIMVIEVMKMSGYLKMKKRSNSDKDKEASSDDPVEFLRAQVSLKEPKPVEPQQGSRAENALAGGVGGLGVGTTLGGVLGGSVKGALKGGGAGLLAGALLGAASKPKPKPKPTLSPETRARDRFYQDAWGLYDPNTWDDDDYIDAMEQVYKEQALEKKAEFLGPEAKTNFQEMLPRAAFGSAFGSQLGQGLGAGIGNSQEAVNIGRLLGALAGLGLGAKRGYDKAQVRINEDEMSEGDWGSNMIGTGFVSPFYSVAGGVGGALLGQAANSGIYRAKTASAVREVFPRMLFGSAAGTSFAQELGASDKMTGVGAGVGAGLGALRGLSVAKNNEEPSLPMTLLNSMFYPAVGNTAGSLTGNAVDNIVDDFKKVAHPIDKDPIDAGDYATHYDPNEEEFEDPQLKQWEQEILPLWQEREIQMNQDPKVQKFKSLITQAEGERKEQLTESFRKYLSENHPPIYETDGELQGLQKMLSRAERKSKFPNNALSPEGKSDYVSDIMGRGAVLGAGLGTLGGAGLGAYMGQDIPSKVGGGILGAGQGLIAGAGLGALGGMGTGPILAALGRPKDKAKHNRQGRINDLGRQIRSREQYLGYGQEW